MQNISWLRGYGGGGGEGWLGRRARAKRATDVLSSHCIFYPWGDVTSRIAL